MDIVCLQRTCPTARLRWVFFLLALTSLLFAAPAFSQDPPDEAPRPTEKQAELNEAGVRALGEGDYVKAVSLLEESLYLGKLNIAYLNLGRAYQLAGKCKKARAALQKVKDAPQVAEPAPGFVDAKAQEYLDELADSCEETATAEKPGEENAPPADKTDVEEGPEETVAPPASAEPTSSSNLWGIAATSAGGVLVAGAVGMHFLWAEPIRQDARDSTGSQGVVREMSQKEFFEAESQANAVDNAALATGVVGGLVTGVGLYLWLSDSPAQEQAVSVSPGPSGTSITYTLTF